MKRAKFGVFLVSLLATLLVLSTAGLANVEDSVDAGVTFDDTLVLDVPTTQNYSFCITQEQLEDTNDNISLDGTAVTADSATVKVWALSTGWKIGATFSDSNNTGETAPGLFKIDASGDGTADTPLQVPGTSSHGGVSASEIVDITGNFSPGSTHWPAADNPDVSLKFNPDALTGSATIGEGDNLTWSIDFWIYESGNFPTSSA